ncbi:hypothetical protein ACFTWF_16760 [Rhodococcus sp. NPDC056960]
MTELQIREAMLATDGIYGLVAKRDGHVVGSALQTSAARSSG